jgi:hypothetical protein
MIERLQQALMHIEDVPVDVQEQLAEQIEACLHHSDTPEPAGRSFAGIWSDLPDDMEDTLLRWRRETPPTPPMDEQLGGSEE